MSAELSKLSTMELFRGSHAVVALCLVVLAVMTRLGAEATLTEDFYDKSCPKLESIVKSEVKKAVDAEKRMAASLIRLHFHDCFVNGCDGSLLLDNSSTIDSEKFSVANNNSVRGFEVIDTIKAAVEAACPKTVSCADILAITSRESAIKVGLTKHYDVLYGRRDSLNASRIDANKFLPAPIFNYSQLVENFAAVGLNETDLVTLAGAHTVGRVHCTKIRTFDNNTNAQFRSTVNKSCPANVSDSVVIDLDFTTPDLFDNQYYKNLEKDEGLLTSDQTLYNTAGSNVDVVKDYAQDQSRFFKQFSLSTIKMGNLKPLTGHQGEIRVNCRVPNSASTLIAYE